MVKHEAPRPWPRRPAVVLVDHRREQPDSVGDQRAVARVTLPATPGIDPDAIGMRPRHRGRRLVGHPLPDAHQRRRDTPGRVLEMARRLRPLATMHRSLAVIATTPPPPCWRGNGSVNSAACRCHSART
jgi:hypothetical protein